MTNSGVGTLRRRQIDRSLLSNAQSPLFQSPQTGWIREVRDALGMSARQLANRMSVTQSTVAKLERSEASGTITLNSLRKAADAMDCTLAYAFVPRRSLETFVQERAESVAQEIVGRAVHTMRLEDQATTNHQQQEHIQELAAELVRTLSRQLWEDATDRTPLPPQPDL